MSRITMSQPSVPPDKNFCVCLAGTKDPQTATCTPTPKPPPSNDKTVAIFAGAGLGIFLLLVSLGNKK